MSELQRQWPDAKFIHIVRDGRHAAVSMKKHAGFVRLINAGFPDEEKHCAYNKQATSFSTTPVTVVDCICFCMRIATDIRQEAERVPQKAYLEVRFEDLLLNPLWEIIRILRFLDAPITLHHLQWAGQLPAPFKISSQWSGIRFGFVQPVDCEGKRGASDVWIFDIEA
jgi:hypothetical protein